MRGRLNRPPRRVNDYATPRALRADIDEAAWSSLDSPVNRPFGKPKTGTIAVKVINHYGDEVLKVFETNL
jgi:adenine-specific DNA-methyltransferase